MDLLKYYVPDTIRCFVLDLIEQSAADKQHGLGVANGRP